MMLSDDTKATILIGAILVLLMVAVLISAQVEKGI